jgi:hypothetical protein
LFTKGNFDILLLQETRTDGIEKELKNGKKLQQQERFSFFVWN